MANHALLHQIPHMYLKLGLSHCERRQETDRPYPQSRNADEGHMQFLNLAKPLFAVYAPFSFFTGFHLCVGNGPLLTLDAVG